MNNLLVGTGALVIGAILFVFTAAHSCAVTLTGHLTNDNTEIRLVARDGSICVSMLRAVGDARSWADDSPGPLRLVPFANVDGKDTQLQWKPSLLRQSHDSIIFTFTSNLPGLTATSEWRARRKFGPIEHSLTINNHGGRTVLLPLQRSMVWESARPVSSDIELLWVEKAAGRPSLTGSHNEVITDGFHRTVLSLPYTDDKNAYSEDWRDRDSIPWTTMWDRRADCGWYAGIEFSGRVSIDVATNRGQICTSMGLAEEPAGSPAFRAKVTAGESYSLPTVFIGCYVGEVEKGCNEMKRWLSDAIRPPVHNPNYPLLTLNSWGSGMAVDQKLANSMMSDAASLGFEMFHIDAGWFRAVGDWRPEFSKFPNGLAEVSDHAHALGLKFGLWVGWTQGGIGAEAQDPLRVVNVHSESRHTWFTHDYAADWKPADFVGADLCLSDLDAQRWCETMLGHAVDEYKLDMLEHDQRMIVSDCDRTDHGHTNSHGDIAFRAALGYYRVYDALRQRNPTLLFEDCVNGGRTIDYGILKRVHYISIVDSYDPLSNRRAFYDTSFAIPPSMCECYVMEMPVKTLPQFRNMLRSGMMGWFTLMQDPSKWTAEQKLTAKREMELYKSELRPLIRTGNQFHVSERPDGIRWDGMQMVSSDRRKCALYCFRGRNTDERHTFRLHGLKSNRHYRLHFVDASQPDLTVSGVELMRKGVEVSLSDTETSQIVLLSDQ